MESKYQEEESIGKELDSTEVLKNNELEPTPEPPPGLEGKLDETKKTKDPKVTTDSPEIIIKPLEERNKLSNNGSVSNKSNDPEPDPNPTPIPPVIIIKPFKKK